MSDETTHTLLVSVTVYGDGTADQAAAALVEYEGTFLFGHGSEAEITSAQPAESYTVVKEAADAYATQAAQLHRDKLQLLDENSALRNMLAAAAWQANGLVLTHEAKGAMALRIMEHGTVTIRTEEVPEGTRVWVGP